jgi:hypothetical protein
MKRTGESFGQGQNTSSSKRRKEEEVDEISRKNSQSLASHINSMVSHVDPRDPREHSVARGSDQTRFEERLLSRFQDHPRADLFAPSRGQQQYFDLVNQAPLLPHASPGFSEMIRHHRLEGAAALLQRQGGVSGRPEQGNFLGFEPADLLRLSQMSNHQDHQDQSLRGLADFRDPRLDPRLSAALAGRLLPEIYGGGQQHQMLALTQKIFESRAAPNPTPPSNNHAFMFGPNSFESRPYGALNRLPAPLFATDASPASNSGDEGKGDDRLIPISLPSDEENISEYQCLVRKQIYLFEARAEDVASNAQGRNRPIVLGQVGIQCCHCYFLSPDRRTRGSVYFPGKLSGLYQAAQNMAINHFTESCQHISETKRANIKLLKEQKAYIVGGGKQYWANGARVLGVQETENGLIFKKRLETPGVR